jgi:hypothetical protein
MIITFNIRLSRDLPHEAGWMIAHALSRPARGSGTLAH